MRQSSTPIAPGVSVHVSLPEGWEQAELAPGEIVGVAPMAFVYREPDDPTPVVIVRTAWLVEQTDDLAAASPSARQLVGSLGTGDDTVHEVLRDVFELPGGTAAYVRRLVAVETGEGGEAEGDDQGEPAHETASRPGAVDTSDSDGQGLVIAQILAAVVVDGVPGCWLFDAGWPNLLAGDELAPHVHALLDSFRLDVSTEALPGAGQTA